MEYQDFTIDLQSIDAGFEAEVVEAPLRDTRRAAFTAPLSAAELSAQLASFEHVPGDPDAPPPPLPQREVGEALCRALFDGPIGELFQQCRIAQTHAASTGLRLRLRFREDDPQAEFLAAVPWEWLCAPGESSFLAIDPATPVVRDLITAPHAPQPLDVAPPLRILIAEATPFGCDRLDTRREIERMKEALDLLCAAGQVELMALYDATADGLRHALKDEGIHVLHFLGHGGYDESSGMGAIFLAKDDGSADQVDGRRFASLLKEIPSLRLVVLNACKTARLAGTCGTRGAALATGVAAAILRHTRVPAVVASQSNILDATAIRWSETFYRRLAAGDGVDEAMTEARLLLHGQRRRDWGLPVLFLASPTGRLFGFEPVRRRQVAIRIGRSRPAGEPVRLSVRSFEDGHGRDLDAQSEGVLPLYRHFTPDGRFILDPEDWQAKVFPELRDFLRERVEEVRPLELHFAAHSSIAFAAGWLLEPKSGLDIRLPQRSQKGGPDGETRIWHAGDGSADGGALWSPRPDRVLDPVGPDRALALAVTWPDVAGHAEAYIQRVGLPVGRLLEVTVPNPGQMALQGGAHALRLAETLLPQLLARQPHERGGRLHIFAAAPNTLTFYLGQLLAPLGRLVLYEFPYKRGEDNYGLYQKSFELPPPGEATALPLGW